MRSTILQNDGFLKCLLTNTLTTKITGVTCDFHYLIYT